MKRLLKRLHYLQEGFWGHDSYRLTTGGLFLNILLGVAACVVVFIASVVFVSRAQGHTICRHWGTQTGITTKFVVLNFLSTGTCLAQTPDGRWLKNTQVQEFIPGGSR